jgi:ferredoxin
MRLSVDAGQCMGHGRCIRILPDLLDFDDEGYVTIRGQAVDIPDDLRELAEDAEGSCPEGAISLISE